MKLAKRMLSLAAAAALSMTMLGTVPALAEDVTINWHYNAEELEDTTTTKAADSRLSAEAPEREGYVLLDWYTDEAMTERFASGTKVSSDMDLYARWGKVYTLEAEYVDLSNFHGQGFSGGCDGAQAISMDKSGMNASNNVYLTYMYNTGLSVDFNFTSSEAVEDAQVILRVSCEKMDISFSSSDFTVTVNGTPLSYADISLTENQEFTDFTIGTGVTLNEGDNVITLTTTNSRTMAGTMYATAPIIDCIKVVSASEIVMDEHK